MSAPRVVRQSLLSYLEELTSLLDRHGALARSALALESRHDTGDLEPQAFAEALLEHAESFAQLHADAALLPRPDAVASAHVAFAAAFADCERVCIEAVAALDADEAPRPVLQGFLDAALQLHEATDRIVRAGRNLETSSA